MGTPHKHRDVIIAWANGEEIEHLDEQGWFVWDSSVGFTPDFNCGNWRIKPKIVKREGWLAVYRETDDPYPPVCGIFESEEEGRQFNDVKRLIRIEWEEEQ